AASRCGAPSYSCRPIRKPPSMIRNLTLILGVVLLPALLAGPTGAVAAEKPPRVEKPGVEAFDPPALEEIDAKAGWIDMPVLDSLALLRDKQKGETPL